MIVMRLSIENYKQYRGEHSFPIGEETTVGVVGANGVGKTTLFEAIEWCLYKPASISNKDIRPRGFGGEVRVTVQLTTIDGNQVFDVERILKRSATQATIYKINEDGSSEPIVQGTREVTDHITTRLIGLSHSAFVATFFTRQKELSFFGNLRPAERRREVGKLLGLETIKQAQALIAEERSRARADADSLQRQFAAQSENRDIKAEIAEASKRIAVRKEDVNASQTRLSAAEKQVADAEEIVDELQRKRERHTTIVSELRNIHTQHQHAVERQSSIRLELELLEQRQTDRDGLAEQASNEPKLRTKREGLEADRERFQKRQQLQREIDRAQKSRGRALSHLRSTVTTVAGADRMAGWMWSESDEAAPTNGIERLIELASAVDVEQADQHLQNMRQAHSLQESLDQESRKLTRFRQRQDELRSQITAMTEGGHPAEKRSAHEAQLDSLRKQSSEANAAITSITRQKETATALMQRLEREQFDDVCPTCGRPFSIDEGELVISTLRETVQSQDRLLDNARTAVRKAEHETQHLQREIGTLQDIELQIEKMRASLDSSRDYVVQQESIVTDHETRLSETLGHLDRKAAPDASDLSSAEQLVAHRRSIRECVQPFGMILRTVSEADQAIQRDTEQLAAIGNVQWDDQAYAAIVAQHDAASRAISAVEQIDQQLARRPQLEADLSQTSQALTELDKTAAEQRRHQHDLGFDPDLLQKATDTLKSARESASNEQKALQITERSAREAEFALETLHKEQEQLADLARRAEEQRRVREELDLMYDEFSAFDRFVAQHQSPMLSDLTSDIVAEMTDGKYDRVVFDEDYGINVFDESGESFALETFSGGERDAISLAARLALSRMIGSQANNPPGFLVLDEIFGSLDAERRERVLTLLGQHSHEYFRQMFIISHIDDVQQSPVFDAVWQVVQQSDGASAVIQQTGALEDAAGD